MKAFQCDACHKVFTIPDRVDDEGFIVTIPGEIYIYSPHGRTASFDLCSDCLNKIMDEVHRIEEENGQK